MRTSFALFPILLLSACAAGGGRPGDGGAGDTGPADVGVDAFDAGNDAGFDAGFDAGNDAGPGEAMTCEACEVHEDCADLFYCVDVGGGRACLPSCNVDLPSCPPRFDCVAPVGASLPETVCVPVGERCCVDPDGDLHGEGLGCLGYDCDEADPDTNASSVEMCNAADSDCNGEVDDGDPAVICPSGAQVQTTACEMGNCTVAECVEEWADCDEDPANGCEAPLDVPDNCGGCGNVCAPENAVPECPDGSCRIDECLEGFGDCDDNVDNGCETSLDSPLDCGSCGRTCAVLNAIPGCDGTGCTVASCNPGFADCDGSPLNGCETSTTTNANCGGCGMVCAPAQANGECSTGSCRVTSCASGWDDCDGDPANGCETNLRTLTNCGGCGVPCTRSGGTPTCITGACELSSCAPLRGDCDGISGNGCETSLDTTTNCNGCGISCNIANGTGGCGGGTCAVSSCNPGWGDCDGNPANGCEARLNTLTNCNGCGTTCNLANGSESCSSGTCTLGTCASGYGDCDGSDANGCERRLNTLSSCGGCGTTCNLPGASESCASGSCTFSSCSTGYSSCDGSTSNGCEIRHAAVGGSCMGGINAGAYDGDRSCGFICGGNTGWDNFRTYDGSNNRTSQWYRAILREDSSCNADVEHRIRLTVPPGINYNLYVYRASNCGSPHLSSTGGTGADESIIYREDDGGIFSGTDSVNYWVEVRYISGASCTPYILYFDGHNC